MSNEEKWKVIDDFQTKYKGRIPEGILELSEEEFAYLISCTDNLTAKAQWSKIRRERLKK